MSKREVEFAQVLDDKVPRKIEDVSSVWFALDATPRISRWDATPAIKRSNRWDILKLFGPEEEAQISVEAAAEEEGDTVDDNGEVEVSTGQVGEVGAVWGNKKSLAATSESACKELEDLPPNIDVGVVRKQIALLIAFFFTSSKLTKPGAERKHKSDVQYKEGVQRDWLQVLINSSIAMPLALGVAYLTVWNDICLDSKKASLVTSLIGDILWHYACCNGDTWSSEIGVHSSSQSQLITTFKYVPHRTNETMIVAGLLVATTGGVVIGVTFVLAGLFTTRCEGQLASKHLLAFSIAIFVGLFGSVVDSILGATNRFEIIDPTLLTVNDDSFWEEVTPVQFGGEFAPEKVVEKDVFAFDRIWRRLIWSVHEQYLVKLKTSSLTAM